jgi:hypothetical protein
MNANRWHANSYHAAANIRRIGIDNMAGNDLIADTDYACCFHTIIFTTDYTGSKKDKKSAAEVQRKQKMWRLWVYGFEGGFVKFDAV